MKKILIGLALSLGLFGFSSCAVADVPSSAPVSAEFSQTQTETVKETEPDTDTVSQEISAVTELEENESSSGSSSQGDTSEADHEPEEPPAPITAYDYEDSYMKQFAEKLAERDFSADMVTYSADGTMHIDRFRTNGSDWYNGYFSTDENDFEVPQGELYVIGETELYINWGRGEYNERERTEQYTAVDDGRLLNKFGFPAEQSEDFFADTDEDGAPREWFGLKEDTGEYAYCCTFDPESGYPVRFDRTGRDSYTLITFTEPCVAIEFDGIYPDPPEEDLPPVNGYYFF